MNVIIVIYYHCQSRQIHHIRHEVGQEKENILFLYFDPKQQQMYMVLKSYLATKKH